MMDDILNYPDFLNYSEVGIYDCELNKVASMQLCRWGIFKWLPTWSLDNILLPILHMENESRLHEVNLPSFLEGMCDFFSIWEQNPVRPVLLMACGPLS